MRDKTSGERGYGEEIRYLSIAAIVLTVLLVLTIILGARWWALEERKLAVEKINRLKKELEICKRDSL